MARTARFAWNNLLTASGVVVTASGTAAGYAASNGANTARWKFWRSTTTNGDQWIKFDLGSSQSIQACVLAHYKAHGSGGTMQLKTSPDDITYTQQGVFVLPSPNATGVIAFWLTNSASVRYVQVYFTNVGAVSDYVEAGACFAGLYFQPSHSVDRGYQLQLVDPSVERRAIGGQRSVVARTMYWTVSRAIIPAGSETDRTSLTSMLAAVGLRTPIFFAIDPDTPAYFVFYGHFTELPSIEHLTVHNWNMPFAFAEDVG